MAADWLWPKSHPVCRGLHKSCLLSVLSLLVLEGKHRAAHDLSVKPQAHMALRTSPAGDLYLPPPTHAHISHFHLFPFAFIISTSPQNVPEGNTFSVNV